MEHVGAPPAPQGESVDAKLSKADILRGFIAERLTAAAREISAVVERTVAGYEEEAAGLRQEVERQRRRLEAVLQPRVALRRIDAFSGSQPVSDQTEEYKDHPEVKEPNHLIPSTGRQSVKKNLGHLNLSVCVLRDLKSSDQRKIVLIQNVTCPLGMDEEDFLAQLRSTFPCLTGPFEAFLTDTTRKLMPLKVKTLTPMEVYKAIQSSGEGRSALYLRLKGGDQQPSFACTSKHKSAGSDPDEIVENEDTGTVSIISGIQHMKTSEGSDQREDLPEPTGGSPAASPSHSAAVNHSDHSDSDGQTDVSDHSLMESGTDLLSSNTVMKKSIIRRSYLPCSASSAANNGEMKSSSTKINNLPQLRVCLVKDARISMLTTAAAVRCQDISGQTEEDEGKDEERTESAEDVAQSTSPHQGPPDARGHPVKTTVQLRDHFNLRVCLLRNSKSNKLKKGMLKALIRVVRCTRGMKEEDFVERLRSIFPQLTEPFEAFTVDASRKLTPLNVKTLTPERIYKSIRSTGKEISALYFRIKQTEKTRKSESCTESVSTSATTRTHGVEGEGSHHHHKCSEDVRTDKKAGESLPKVEIGKYLKLRVCLLLDTDTRVIKRGVLKSPIQEVKFAKSMKEADFRDQLRSIFPSLTGPFSAFITDISKKLIPLTLKTLTPEGIYRSIKSTGKGRSALYIRPKPSCGKESGLQMGKRDATTASTTTREESGKHPSTGTDLVEKVENKEPESVSSKSGTRQAETDDDDGDNLPYLSGDSTGPSTPPPTAQMEENHSDHSSPENRQTDNNDQNLTESKAESHSSSVKRKRSARRSFLDFTDNPVSSSEGDASDISVCEDELDADWKPGQDEDSKSYPTKTGNPLLISVCLLKDTVDDTLTTKSYTSPPQMLRCPRGLQERSFLDLLRSSFPELSEDDQSLQMFLTDKNGRLQPLEVQKMTPEEICKSMKSNGNGTPALYIRLKETEESTRNKEHRPSSWENEQATSRPPSASTTKNDKNNAHASSYNSRVETEKNSEADNARLQIQIGTQEDRQGEDCGRSQPTGAGASVPALPASESEDNSADDEVEKNERDDDWTPDMNAEEQGGGKPDAKPSKTTGRRRSDVKTKKGKRPRLSPGETAEGVRPCRVCGCVCGSTNILIKHAWSHVANPDRLCGVCGERAESAEDLRRHLSGHLKTLVCNICGKSFISKPGLRGHIARHKGYQPYKCKTCHKRFSDKTALNIHSWDHAVEKPFQCDICHRPFAYKYQLAFHTREHTGERPYSCDVCGKSFRYLRCLSFHKLVHTGQKPHACQVCDKKFITRGKLAAHEKIHTVRDRSYLCDVCCKAFYSQEILKAHLKTHSREKTLCSECGKGFSSAGALKRHMMIHAGERPYSCSECGKAFNSLSTLRGHAKTHTGEKSFVCGICGRACARREHLKIHMRTHNGERPYKCTLCNKDFTQSHCLKSHMKIHQGEEQSAVDALES